MKHFLILIMTVLAVTVMAQEYTMRATKYHPGMGGAGWVTASGSRIDNSRLKNYEIRWVALSPDMVSQYGFKMGYTIVVKCDRVPKLEGKWVVKDRMGARLRKRIDFLLPRGDNYGFTSPVNVTIEKQKE